jgi:hypothetical protein
MAQRNFAVDRFPAIERPICTKCEIAMWLARVQPNKPGYDKRTFECPVCLDEMVVVVKSTAA